MKFSICTTWGKQKRLEDIVELAVSLGLDGVEIWDGHIDEFMTRNRCGFNYFVDKLDMMDAYEKLEQYIIHYHLKNYYWRAEPVPPYTGEIWIFLVCCR